MIGQGTLDQRAAEGRPWLVRFKTITGLGVVGKVLQVKDTGTGPYLRVQETYTEREWKTWAAPEGVGDIHWVAADEETLELHGVDEAAPPSQEMVYTVVGDPQPTPITQDQFYLIFGVSLRPHYGPGVNNGCVGGDNLGLAHVSGCTGDCNLPESVADVAIAESWSDSEYKAGDAVVKLPPEEAVDLGLAEGETYDVHFEVLDISDWRLVMRDDGYVYAAAPLALANSVVSYEASKRHANTKILEAHASLSNAYVDLRDMGDMGEHLLALETVKSNLESIRVAVCRARKEAV